MLKIDFGNPIIGEHEVMEISLSTLDDFYVKADEVDKFNLFFVLLASLHHYLDKADRIKAAHLSFLTAYYLFTPLTPPASYSLALHYIEKAISLNPIDTYREWLSIIEKGN